MATPPSNLSPCACRRTECVLCGARLPSERGREEFCEIHGMRTRETYPPQATLFRAGDPNTYLFAVREGHVKLTMSGPEGKEQILGLRGAGQLLGFDSMHDDVYWYTAKALSNVQVCKVPRADILTMLSQNPAVSLRIIKRLNKGLAQAQALIRELGVKSAKEKIASFLLSLPASPHGQSELVAVPLPRQEIGAMLGLKPETVSRAIGELKRAGLIDPRRDKIQILERMRLRVAAGEIVVIPTGRGRRPRPT